MSLYKCIVWQVGISCRSLPFASHDILHETETMIVVVGTRTAKSVSHVLRRLCAGRTSL